MDELDKIIIENRADFGEEPPEGHFDRFAERLRIADSKRKGLQFTPFLKIAAVLVVILLSANLYIHFRSAKSNVIKEAELKSDLAEASFYYTNSINNGISDLERMASEGIGSKKELVQIKQELSEMDSLFMNLKQEYKANPNDERIINAMIEYYQTKLDIVNTIKTDLENVKKLKTKYHENPEM